MDFIERFWQISPDGGTGTLELALLLIPVAIVFAMRRRHTTRSNRPRVG